MIARPTRTAPPVINAVGCSGRERIGWEIDTLERMVQRWSVAHDRARTDIEGHDSGQRLYP